MPDTTFESYALVELLGRKQYTAFVREIELGGAKLLRLDIPLPGGGLHPYYVGGGSIYGITPLTPEDLSQVHMLRNQDALGYSGLLTSAEAAAWKERQDLEAAEQRARWALPGVVGGFVDEGDYRDALRD